ncbi:MAG TPA: FtsQ-type POTRA domain-containing protein [Solirubrobacteraceae bacterium]|nr:FtsQ-type POTRA domain-containing protein [Solirubrobacteraceae bacterium]
MASLARRRTRVVLAVAVLLVVLAPLALWLRDSSVVAVRQVTVTGVEGPQAEQIRRALRSAGLDMTTLHVRKRALLAAVAAYPVVRSVRTETDFPHGLRIVVNAHEAVGALRAAGGGVTAVAADGTLLRGSATRGLPTVGVRATPGGDRLTAREDVVAVRLLAAAPRPLRARIARVFRGARGVTATMQDGPKLYFGGAARLGAKWSAAVQVLAHPTSRGAAYVDLRAPDRPVAGGLQPRPANSQPQL